MRDVVTSDSVVEYTTLSAACQRSAKSRMTGEVAARDGSVSQPVIISYIRRP